MMTRLAGGPASGVAIVAAAVSAGGSISAAGETGASTVALAELAGAAVWAGGAGWAVVGVGGGATVAAA